MLAICPYNLISVCGGNLEGSDHGEFSSPGYPGNYPHDRDCVWIITVSPGNKILFQFATLELEIHPDCQYDYLEVRILHFIVLMTNCLVVYFI